MDEQSKILKQVDQVIIALKQDKIYQNFLIVQEELKNNKEILTQIETIKTIQKKYVKSGKQDKTLKKELELLEKKLESIPLYQTYLGEFQLVDELLRTIESRLNQCFEEILK